MQVIKKNGNQEEWNDEKIVKAILKSADHSSLEITKNQATQVAEYCKKQIQGNVVETSKLHGIVIDALRMLGYSEIANSYRNYRNFKETDYETWREMYEQAEHIIYRGDNENANFDSSLISTKGSLIKGNATKRIYQDFILNKNEKFLTRRGDIYIHDMRDMIFGSVNCCLFDIANVLKNGFTMSNIKYSEPNSVLSALQVIGDITLVATAQQFGGFTLPEIDKVLLPYVKKSFNKYMDMYTHRKISKLDAEKYATEDTLKELQQGFQGLELKLNTVPCSRGDFAFTTLTFGQWDVNLAENDKYWLKEISRTILDTRRIGHNGVSVVFPKLVYLYDENQINNDHYSSELFDIAVKTSAKCMYPDYLSLSGDIEHNKVAQEYSEHGTIISPMGALAGHEHLYVKIGNNDPVDMSIKDFFDFCNGDKLKNVRPCKIFFNKDELEYKRSNTVTEATNVGHNSGVYSITYIPEDVTYIGSTSDLQRRFNEHRCKIKTIGGLDSGLNFKDRDINNYKFEVLEESENYKELEQKYIESIPNVNYKGNNTKYYKATRGNTKLYTRPNFRNKNIPQILIDLKDKDIIVLDRNYTWV